MGSCQVNQVKAISWLNNNNKNELTNDLNDNNIVLLSNSKQPDSQNCKIKGCNSHECQSRHTDTVQSTVSDNLNLTSPDNAQLDTYSSMDSRN